ncbi:hypothetical protein F444_01604, partial [Phytophthora nicotianae P1976]
MEVSASELLAYGEAGRIIRDEWRQYEEGAENLPIARGSLRCTFVLEPLAVDFLGMMMHSEMIKTVEILIQNNIWFSQLKRLRLELHQDLWDNELESKKAFGQLFTGLFDSTRHTNLYSSKPDSFQLDQLQLFSISTMAASDFVALASALTVNQTRVVEDKAVVKAVGPETDGDEQEIEVPGSILEHRVVDASEADLWPGDYVGHPVAFIQPSGPSTGQWAYGVGIRYDVSPSGTSLSVLVDGDVMPIKLQQPLRVIKSDPVTYALQVGATVSDMILNPTELLQQQDEVIAACRKRRGDIPSS